MSEAIRDMSDADSKQRLIDFVRSLSGPHRISIVKFRQRRSDRQNRYYHPCLVKPYADALREHGNDITNEQAHGDLKRRFLTREIECPKTGLRVSVVGSTAELDTREFNEYLDRCAAFLAEWGVEILDPAPYYEREGVAA